MGYAGSAAATVSNNNISGAYYGHLLYSVSSTPVSTVSGGTITAVVQGVAVINGSTPGGLPFLPTTANISGITMNSFAGSYPQAGIYTYTAGANPAAILTLNISEVNISGTGKPTADAAGLNFSDFSTESGVRQNITVSNSTISGNANRGINARGPHAVVNVNTSTISGNGFDGFNSPNIGYGVIALEGATLNLNNNFITNLMNVSIIYLFKVINMDHVFTYECLFNHTGYSKSAIFTENDDIVNIRAIADKFIFFKPVTGKTFFAVYI